MRRAVIDLGTNTFNLLIADVFSSHFSVLHSEKMGVAIGMGGINDGIITEDAWKRSFDALVHFKSVCDEMHVESIQAFGTSAFRSAKNASDFLNDIKSQTGIQIQIISGLDEARLIYEGVKWSYDFNHEAVIMDIGGGSTEFIWADKLGMNKAISLDIGVSRLYQLLKHEDPLTQSNVDDIENWLEIQSKGQLDNRPCPILIGASGSFETFFKLHNQSEFPEGIEAIKMEKSDLEVILEKIIFSTLAEREENPLIIPIRKIMAPIAAVKTRWVMKKLNVQELWISPCALKEGALGYDL